MGEIVVAQKEPSHMSPQECNERGMRILAFIAVRMMHAMSRNPARRGILQAAQCECDERPFEPTWNMKTSVSQKSVIPHRDRLTKDVNSNDARNQSSPGKEHRHDRKKCDHMNENDGKQIPKEYFRRYGG